MVTFTTVGDKIDIREANGSVGDILTKDVIVEYNNTSGSITIKDRAFKNKIVRLQYNDITGTSQATARDAALYLITTYFS